LLEHGIRLEMLDLGGGFPARYVARVPSLANVAEAIYQGLDELLPYQPGTLVAEPGRHLVAEGAVMVTSVLGREVRAGENWVYLDVGAYNGLMETQQTVNQWRFPCGARAPTTRTCPTSRSLSPAQAATAPTRCSSASPCPRPSTSATSCTSA